VTLWPPHTTNLSAGHRSGLPRTDGIASMACATVAWSRYRDRDEVSFAFNPASRPVPDR
jgi:hypothetical protein